MVLTVKTQVLFDINLDFQEGSFNSIIGASGDGKSTLLNIIGTLDKPTSGEVYIAGKRTDLMKKNELAELRNETMPVKVYTGIDIRQIALNKLHSLERSNSDMCAST